jgi:hypothetical protein
LAKQTKPNEPNRQNEPNWQTRGLRLAAAEADREHHRRNNLPGRHAQQLLVSSSKPNQQRKNFQQPELALPVT